MKIPPRRTPAEGASGTNDRATVRVHDSAAITPADAVGRTMHVEEAGKTILAGEVSTKAQPPRTMVIITDARTADDSQPVAAV